MHPGCRSSQPCVPMPPAADRGPRRCGGTRPLRTSTLPERSAPSPASSSSTPREESFSRSTCSTTGSRMFQDVEGCTARATALDGTVTRPFSSMRLTDSRMTVRLTPNLRTVAFGRERLPGCDLSRDDGTDQVMDHGDAEPCRGGTCVACGEKCAAAGRRCSLTHSVSVSSGQMAIGSISRPLSLANRRRDADPLGGSARAALPSRARLRCAGS